MRSARARAVAVVAVAAAALGGCGDSSDDAASTKPDLPPDFNLQRFTCADWEKANRSTREYVVKRVGEINGGAVTGAGYNAHGSTLAKDKAMELFDNRCGDPATAGFVVYKLYGHAAGFGGA